MDKLLNFIFDSIPEDATPKIIILFFLFASFIYALSQANIIYDFIDKFNKRELLILKKLLSDENISERAKITLRQKIDLIAYEKVTGIKTNIYMQEQITNHYNYAKGKLKYSDFKRAFAFLKIDRNGVLIVREPNIFEYASRIYWIIASVAVFIFISLLSVAFFYASISIEQRITLFLLIICFGVILYFFSFQASSIPIAKKIREEIKATNKRNKSNKYKHGSFQKKQLRPYGLCKGEFTVPDDFDDPLPEDILNAFEAK